MGAIQSDVNLLVRIVLRPPPEGEGAKSHAHTSIRASSSIAGATCVDTHAQREKGWRHPAGQGEAEAIEVF